MSFGTEKIFHGIHIGQKKVEQKAFDKWLQEARYQKGSDHK